MASSLTLTADAPFSDLAEKQMDALLTAYSHGYYRLPRKTDVKTILSRLLFLIFNYLEKHP